MHVHGELSGALTSSGKLSGIMSAPRGLSGTLAASQRTLAGTLSRSGQISGILSMAHGISGSLTIPSAVGVDPYTGAVTVTPSGEMQTLQTHGKYLSQDVTINPIPSNYGLITWNGATLTVS